MTEPVSAFYYLQLMRFEEMKSVSIHLPVDTRV
jgi:hypothetical protein